MRRIILACAVVGLWGCSDPESGVVDAGADLGAADSGIGSDLGAGDAAVPDSAVGDASGFDAAAMDAGANDATVPSDSATVDASHLGDPCTTDLDCVDGAEWCVGGVCETCSHDPECRIVCAEGTTRPIRNGCEPCECVPEGECSTSADCDSGDACYMGGRCPDWCMDSSCCYGNQCSEAGCTTPDPTGCSARGCADGFECNTETGCVSSGCSCSGGSWICTEDCSGGLCVAL